MKTSPRIHHGPMGRSRPMNPEMHWVWPAWVTWTHIKCHNQWIASKKLLGWRTKRYTKWQIFSGSIASHLYAHHGVQRVVAYASAIAPTLSASGVTPTRCAPLNLEH